MLRDIYSIGNAATKLHCTRLYVNVATVTWILLYTINGSTRNMRDHQLATANAQAAAMRNMKDHQLATANALEKMFTALEVFHIVIV